MSGIGKLFITISILNKGLKKTIYLKCAGTQENEDGNFNVLLSFFHNRIPCISTYMGAAVSDLKK